VLSAPLEKLWVEYLRAEQDGARSIMLRALERFIADLLREPPEVWRQWAKQLASTVADGGDPTPIRYPLYERVLAPALVHGIQNGEPGCARWLGSLSHSSQWLPAELAPALRSPVDLLKEAVRIDPGDDVARSRLVEIWARYLKYTLHEIPAGVLDAATVEECEELLVLLQEFKSHVAALRKEAEWAGFEQRCEFHFRAYARYLQERPVTGGYAEFLQKYAG
jgi:hypothetical protein